MSVTSQPDERSDALEIYLGQGGHGALSLAVAPGGGPAPSGAVQRVTSAALRGGLTGWVHVGMMVRRMRGRSDPLQGLGQRETFQALSRLVEAALEARPMPGHPDGAAPAHAGSHGATGRFDTRPHLRMLTTALPAEQAMAAIEQVLKPYAAAGSLTRTGPAVIGWFAIRHLIATRSPAYSLQIVHLSPPQVGPCQVSLMLPRTAEDDRATVPTQAAGQAVGAAAGSPARVPAVPAPVRLRAAAPLPASAAAAAAVRSMLGSRRGRRAARTADDAGGAGAPGHAGPAGPGVNGSAGVIRAGGGNGIPSVNGAGGVNGSGGGTGAGVTMGVHPLQGYLDAYREHLTRELLLEPLVSSGSAAEFAWAPETTGDGGVAVGGTVPGRLSDQVVLRMAANAVAQLGERSPQSAGTPLGGPEPDGDLLVQRWAVGPSGGFVLSVAARTGARRRPTQVLIHFAAASGRLITSLPDPTPSPPGGMAALEAPYQVPRTGPDVDDARALLLLPLWWHSAEARCDGNDVILYEMPFRGKRLRVRANDYPAEPMYTLLVGNPGAEVAAVDVEHWPSSWVRPRSF